MRWAAPGCVAARAAAAQLWSLTPQRRSAKSSSVSGPSSRTQRSCSLRLSQERFSSEEERADLLLCGRFPKGVPVLPQPQTRSAELMKKDSWNRSSPVATCSSGQQECSAGRNCFIRRKQQRPPGSPTRISHQEQLAKTRQLKGAPSV